VDATYNKNQETNELFSIPALNLPGRIWLVYTGL